MRSSESRPRKVELTINMHAFKKRDNYYEYYTHNNKTCIYSYENLPYDHDNSLVNGVS